MNEDDFDSSGMSDEEYQEYLREYIDRQQTEEQDEITQTYGADVIVAPEVVEEADKQEFSVRFDFTAKVMNVNDVEEWSKLVLQSLPDGTSVTIEATPKIVDVYDLTERHIGSKVRLVAGNRTVDGTLDAIYQTGGSAYSRTLIIDGEGYQAAFGLVTVNPN